MAPQLVTISGVGNGSPVRSRSMMFRPRFASPSALTGSRDGGATEPPARKPTTASVTRAARINPLRKGVRDISELHRLAEALSDPGSPRALVRRHLSPRKPYPASRAVLHIVDRGVASAGCIHCSACATKHRQWHLDFRPDGGLLCCGEGPALICLYSTHIKSAPGLTPGWTPAETTRSQWSSLAHGLTTRLWTRSGVNYQLR